MTNNDILRKMRYIFDYSDDQMIALFKSGGKESTRAEISNWLKKDDAEDYKSMQDSDLAVFLNGFINEKRGKRDGVEVKPEKSLNNNVILRKLKIALNLNDDGMIRLFDKAEFKVSKAELSALFRKPDHKHYRPCKDQFLRNFLLGMQLEFRKTD